MNSQQLCFKVALNPDDTNLLVSLYEAYIVEKDIKNAYLILKKLYSKNKKNLHVIEDLSIYAYKLGNFEDAIYWCDKYIECKSDNSFIYYRVGKSYFNLLKYDKSIPYLIKACEYSIIPGVKIKSLISIVCAYEELRKFKDAILYCKLLYKESKNLNHLYMLVSLYINNRNYIEAEKILNDIPLNKQHNAKHMRLLAKCFVAKGDASNSICILEKLKKEDSKDYWVNLSLSKSYARLDRFSDAIYELDLALENGACGTKDILIDKALLHSANRELETTIIILKKLDSENPDDAEIKYYLANALYDSFCYVDAMEYIQQAIRLKGDKFQYHLMRAHIYTYIAEEDETLKPKLMEYFFKALELNPMDGEVISHISKIMDKTSPDIAHKLSYTVFEPIKNKYMASKNNGQDFLYNEYEAHIISMYTYYCLLTCNYEHYDVAKEMSNLVAKEQYKLGIPISANPFLADFVFDRNLILPINKAMANACNITKNKLAANKIININNKIKIGYISPDFTIGHPVGFLINNLFKYHSREKFSIYAYSISEVVCDDQKQDSVLRYSDFIRDISKLSYEDAAKVVYEDEIDILINLAGYTKNGRAQIQSFMPAPIQVQFLGQTNSMGADYVQYHIGSKAAIPERNYDLYSESLILLNTQIATKPMNDLAPPSRAEYSLPEDKIVFCNFNAGYRIDYNSLKLWGRILSEVKNSILWVLTFGKAFEKNFIKNMKEYGVDESRIIFKSKKLLNSDWHIKLADIYLDTLSVSGGTTGIISAAAGVPVISLLGNTPASCYGAGVLAANQMEELIVRSTDEYFNLAVKLANNHDKLKQVKEKIYRNKDISDLFNNQKFAKMLDKAFLAMIEHHNAKRPREIIKING